MIVASFISADPSCLLVLNVVVKQLTFTSLSKPGSRNKYHYINYTMLSIKYIFYNLGYNFYIVFLFFFYRTNIVLLCYLLLNIYIGIKYVKHIIIIFNIILSLSRIFHLLLHR